MSILAPKLGTANPAGFWSKSTVKCVWKFTDKTKPPFFTRRMAGSTRLELAASAVTGRRSNQLNYDPACVTRTNNLDPDGPAKQFRVGFRKWWAVRDSNPRHPACKAGALTN